MNNKILSFISLATKAGKISSGEFSAEKTIKERKACLVIVAEDASEHTKNKFVNMCNFYNVPIFFFGTKDELGHFTGKELRATLAVTDEGFAKGIAKCFK